ncbi:MAG: hypothetical protein V1843_03300 [bacterium]
MKKPKKHNKIKIENLEYIKSDSGKTKAVILNIEDFENLLETIEVSSDKEMLQAIKEGEADIRAGRIKPFNKVFGRS